MSDSRPGRRKQGKVIKIRDLPDNPISAYLARVAADNRLTGGISAAGQLVLDSARMTGEFLSPASMQELRESEPQP